MKLRDLFSPFRKPNGVDDDELREMDRKVREHEKARDETLVRLHQAVEKLRQQDAQLFPMMAAQAEMYRRIVGDDDLRRMMTELGKEGLPD